MLRFVKLFGKKVAALKILSWEVPEDISLAIIDESNEFVLPPLAHPHPQISNVSRILLSLVYDTHVVHLIKEDE